jgi:hypothetical protein
MAESTLWEIEYAEEAEEIAAALAAHALGQWPHTWPVTVAPDGDPMPTEWDPEPPDAE